METKIDWKKKLTSRKLWAAVCALVANLIIAFGGTEQESVQITAIIMAGAAIIAYIIGEGLVDAADAKNPEYFIDAIEPENLDAEEHGNG